MSGAAKRLLRPRSFAAGLVRLPSVGVVQNACGGPTVNLNCSNVVLSQQQEQ